MSDVLRLGKKFFTMSVVAMTTAWSMGLSLLVPAIAVAADCPTLEAGDLFKVANNSAVYLVNADMKRMYFPHQEVYKSWYEDFSGVVVIPNTCVDNYPSGGGVNFRAGSRLIKTVISPNVFAVGPKNMKHKLSDPAVAAALYGANWAKLVRDLPDVFDANYGVGAALTEAKPHNGQLIKKAGGDVYFVKDGALVKVDGALGAAAAGDVRTVSEATFNAVSMGSGTVTAGSLVADPAQGGTALNNPPAAGPAGTLTVSLAGDTPNGTFAVDGSARVPFTKVTFSATGGDATVTSFKVSRGGAPAVNSDFSTVNVIDENGNLLNDSGKSLNSDNLVTFTEDIKVANGTSKTYTLVGDMASNVGGGNVPKLGLFSLETTSNVVAALPLYGNAVTTNTNVTLGTVTLAQGVSIGTVTKQVGSNNVDLASLKVTVATNDFQVERIVLYNASTTEDNDVQSYKLKYNNNVVATGVMKNKYLTFDLKGCTADCKIEKGNDRTYSVTGDIVNGSARTLDLDVQKAVHVLVRDLKEGYYVTPTNNATAMTNAITISQGKLNVTKVDNVMAGNVPTNASGVALASFDFQVMGEPIDVRTLVLRVSTTGTVVPTGFDAVTIYDANGKALIGGIDASGSASPGYASSTDSFTLPVGDNILTVKAKIDSTPAANDTVMIDVDMRNTTNFEAKGVNSGETITLGTYATPQALVNGNVQTIKTSALRVTQLPTPATTTYAAGVSGILLAQVMLDAGASSEDLKVTQFKVTDAADNGAKTINIQNIRLYVDKDGDSFNGTGADVGLTEVKNGSDSTANNDEAFTFNLSGDDQFVIKAGKQLVVSIKGSISGGAATGNHVFKTTAANDVTATGVRTGNEVSEVVDGSALPSKVTVGTSGGTVAVTLDSSNPASANYAAGTTGVMLGAFNFLATTTEDVELDTIYLTQISSTTAASAAFQDYARLYLVDENGKTVGSVVPTSTKPYIDLNAGAFIVRTNDTDGAILKVMADLSAIGPSNNVSVGGHFLGFNITDVTDVTVKGALTGTTGVRYFGSTLPNGTTHYMYKGIPTVASIAIPTTLGASAELFRFKVTANTSDIGLYKFVFDIATSGVTMTQLELYDITDSSEVQLFSSSSPNGPNPVRAEIYLDSANPTSVASQGKEVVVSKSVPRTFSLRGSFSGVSSGDSVTVRMAGDSALPNTAYTSWVVQTSGATLTGLRGSAMASTTAIQGSVYNDFIWSDRSASAHATTTDDWTNGFVVSGLSSASSSARTLNL